MLTCPTPRPWSLVDSGHNKGQQGIGSHGLRGRRARRQPVTAGRGAWTQWVLFTCAGADQPKRVSRAGRRAEGQLCPGPGWGGGGAQLCLQQDWDLPTWEGGQAAGQGAALAVWPIPLLQLALQGVELAVAAVDEVLGAPLCLHLDDKNLGQRPGVGPRRPGAKGREVLRV